MDVDLTAYGLASANPVVPGHADTLELLRRSEAVVRSIVSEAAPLVSGKDTVLGGHSARIRATAESLSRLLTVAFVGNFSSGKSTVVSALSHPLAASRVTTADGVVHTVPVTLLPASEGVTTSCPIIIEPVGPAGAPMRVVAAAALAKGAERRPTGLDASSIEEFLLDGSDGLTENVNDIELFKVSVQGLPSAAVLVDLPGCGNPRRTHNAVVLDFLQRVDIVVFVSSADRTHDHEEDELWRELLTQSALTRKGRPILALMTKTDRARDVGRDGVPAFQTVLRKNQAHVRAILDEMQLEEPEILWFTVSVHDAFYGQLAAVQDGRSSEVERAGRSGLAEFNAALRAVCERDTGPRAVVQALDGLDRDLSSARRHVSAVVNSATASQRELRRLEGDLSARMERFAADGRDIEAWLGSSQQHLIAELFSGACGSRLADRFRADLTPTVERLSAKLNSRDLKEVERARAASFVRWSIDEDDGVLCRWRTQWAAIARDAERQAKAMGCDLVNGVRKLSDVADLANDIGEDLSTNLPGARPSRVWDAATFTATASGGVAAALGIAGVAAALTPFGVVLGVGGLLALAKRYKGRRDAGDNARSLYLGSLDDAAAEAVAALRSAAESEAAALVTALKSSVGIALNECRAERATVQKRLADGNPKDTAERVERVEGLAANIDACRAELKVIRALAGNAAPSALA